MRNQNGQCVTKPAHVIVTITNLRAGSPASGLLFRNAHQPSDTRQGVHLSHGIDMG
ncbi:MAG TPA: hypothetical protein PKH32_09015 [Verrucomicrobiota bacterium]|nr:hypothetical protein [Verrucomicrobiota bacterium]